MRALRVLLGVPLDFSTCPREHRPTQPDMSPPTGLVTLGGASGTGPPTLSVPSVLLSPASGRVVGGGGEPRQMGGSGQFFDQHPAQDLGAVVAEDWQCLRRLAARVAATDGSAPDHRERCGPCRLLARIATPFWTAFLLFGRLFAPPGGNRPFSSWRPFYLGSASSFGTTDLVVSGTS